MFLAMKSRSRSRSLTQEEREEARRREHAYREACRLEDEANVVIKPLTWWRRFFLWLGKTFTRWGAT
jgi:hypothetical protein